MSCFEFFYNFMWTRCRTRRRQEPPPVRSLLLPLCPWVGYIRITAAGDCGWLLLCCLSVGAALDLSLAGGECVWQPGRHHRWLEPASPSPTEQRVPRCYGVPEPQVATGFFLCVLLQQMWNYLIRIDSYWSLWFLFQWPNDEAGV